MKFKSTDKAVFVVTGGLGFIGSHTVVELQNHNYEVLVVDDLSNSSEDVLDGIERITGKKPFFELLDLRNKTKVSALFKKYKTIAGIIHFAAYKAVGESVEKPLEYYENNLVSLTNILFEIKQSQRSIPFIFSSSCTVYGQADELPISELAAIKPAESPYGNTKQIGEEILKDASLVMDSLNVIALRYFNPIGAHSSNEIGELPLGKPQNLVPFITQTAAGIYEKLTVFGDDYPTVDGTCVRDYIHVVDLAIAHVIALKKLLNNEQKSAFEVFNLGTGKGSTVLEVVQSFERVSGLSLNYIIGNRRSGDVIAAYADTSKATKELGWKTERSLDEAVESAWAWEKKIRGI